MTQPPADRRFAVEIEVTYRFSTIEGAPTAGDACEQAGQLVRDNQVDHMKMEDRVITLVSAHEL